MTTVKEKRNELKTNPTPIAGARGAAIASILLANIEQAADKLAAMEKAQAQGQKETLVELVLLDRPGHLKFREALDDRRKQIHDAAKAQNLSLNKYRETNPRANSIIAQVPMWDKYSRAIEAGWKPALNETLRTLREASTAYLDSAAARERQEKLTKELVSVKADLASGKLEGEALRLAEAKATVAEAQIKAAAEHVGPTVKTGRTKATGLQKAQKYLLDNIQTERDGVKIIDVVTLREVHAWLGNYLAAHDKQMSEAAAKQVQPDTRAPQSKPRRRRSPKAQEAATA